MAHLRPDNKIQGGETSIPADTSTGGRADTEQYKSP